MWQSWWGSGLEWKVNGRVNDGHSSGCNPRLEHVSTRQAFGGYERSVSLLSNSQSVVPPLERLVSRGHAMLVSRAYVYQYVRHGIEIEDFNGAFAQLEQAILNYKGLF